MKPVHPTQLYEFTAALLLSLLAFWMLKKKRPDGTTLLVFTIGFSLFRLFDSYLMVDTSSAPFYFYPALYLSIIALSLFLLKKVNTSRSHSKR